MSGRKICVGAIVGAHGVRGQIRLRSFTAEPEDVVSYGTLTDESGEKKFPLKIVGVMKDHIIASIKGVDDRNKAEALKGTGLYIDRVALPETEANEYYDADLIGLAVRDEAGVVQGKILSLHDYGAGPFLEIKPESSASYMLPFTDACVPVVDIAGGFVTIIVPQGWLDPAKPDPEEMPDKPKKARK